MVHKLRVATHLGSHENVLGSRWGFRGSRWGPVGAVNSTLTILSVTQNFLNNSQNLRVSQSTQDSKFWMSEYQSETETIKEILFYLEGSQYLYFSPPFQQEFTFHRQEFRSKMSLLSTLEGQFPVIPHNSCSRQPEDTRIHKVVQNSVPVAYVVEHLPTNSQHRGIYISLCRTLPCNAQSIVFTWHRQSYPVRNDLVAKDVETMTIKSFSTKLWCSLLRPAPRPTQKKYFICNSKIPLARAHSL